MVFTRKAKGNHKEYRDTGTAQTLTNNKEDRDPGTAPRIPNKTKSRSHRPHKRIPKTRKQSIYSFRPVCPGRNDNQKNKQKQLHKTQN